MSKDEGAASMTNSFTLDSRASRESDGEKKAPIGGRDVTSVYAN
jgi:hypothetical protein